ncbi:putative zinc-binding metallopeptidase [soil metagenome]
MVRLHCPTCGNEIFFDSLVCVRCHTELAVHVPPDGRVVVEDAADVGTCRMRDTWACNWRPPPHAPDGWCENCVTVAAGRHADNHLLVLFQAAQRRALAQLTQLGVAWQHPPAGGRTTPPLRFTYLSRSAGDEAVIGHVGGHITLDLDEADPARGEQIRTTLGEEYRTPLGHIRHELGHYMWLCSVAGDPARLDRFRAMFGDERADYREALDRHYSSPDDGSWRDQFVSHYASAHPWEDFAESWAQVMHTHDVVSTGASWGVIDLPSDRFEPRSWVSAAVRASLAANELARSMGMRDLYPFALASRARRRIETCWELVSGAWPDGESDGQTSC